jgi:hypothetical protein
MGIKHSARGPMQGSIWRDVLKGRCRVATFQNYGEMAFHAECDHTVIDAVKRATVIDATGVKEQIVYRNGLFDVKDLPTMAPPFPFTWIENEVTQDAPDLLLRLATLWSSVKTDEGWDSTVSAFVKSRHGGSIMVGRHAHHLHEDGSYAQGATGYNVGPGQNPNLADIENSEAGRIVERQVSRCLAPHAFAISLMHCKNIEVRDNEVPMSAKHRERDERNGIPRLIFKTLAVGPMLSTRSINSVNHPSQSIERAFHICRGHFAEYTEEKPLFGKYAGRFWIEQHARGSKAAGIVQKDYRVNAA